MTHVFFVTTTCFDAQGALDLGMQRAVWERTSAAGVGLYVGSASPGEGYALERDEVSALLRLAVEVGGGVVERDVRGQGLHQDVSARHSAHRHALREPGNVHCAQIRNQLER